MRHSNEHHGSELHRPDTVLAAVTPRRYVIATDARPDSGPVDLSGAAGLRSVFRVRGFRRLWAVLGIASLGDWIGLLATALFASSLFSNNAAKGAAFGGTIAIRLLPALVLGPIAGVLA